RAVRQVTMICAKLAPLASGTVAAWGAWTARAESGWSQLNMPRGVTEISRKIYDLHMEIFWVCVAIAAVVFGAMIWSILTYSKSRGAIPDGTLVHNTKVERSEEHTSELQSLRHLVCRLLLEKKNNLNYINRQPTHNESE